MTLLRVTTVTGALRCTRSGLATKLGINRVAVYQWGEFVPESRMQDCEKLIREASGFRLFGYGSNWGAIKLSVSMNTKTPVERTGV